VEVNQKSILPLLEEGIIPTPSKRVASLLETSQARKFASGIGPDDCSQSRVVVNQRGILPLRSEGPTKPGMKRATLLNTYQQTHISREGSNLDPR